MPGKRYQNLPHLDSWRWNKVGGNAVVGGFGQIFDVRFTRCPMKKPIRPMKPLKPIEDMRGFLKGMNTEIIREKDRLLDEYITPPSPQSDGSPHPAEPQKS